MIVRQYMPAYFDPAIERAEVEVSSLNELLALPWVARWREDPAFRYFCWDKPSMLLMAQMEKAHWVIAQIPEPEPWIEQLPAWTG